MRRLLLIWFVSAVLITTSAAGRTWYIKPDGTGDAATIQAGIDTASTNDEVVLTDGVFSGSGNCDLDLRNKDITLRSQSGDPDMCTVDCAQTGPGLTMTETASRVEGISIINGTAVKGGGICVDSSCPTIVNCVFVGNSASSGGAVWIGQFMCGSVTFTGCVFRDNRALETGGAAYCTFYGPAVFTGCTFAGNSAPHGGAVYCGFYGSCTLTDCTLTGNSASVGGAICMSGGRVNLVGSTVSGNSADSHGGGIAAYAATMGADNRLEITNAIVAYSMSGEALWLEPTGYFAELDVGCSNVYGNSGGDWIGCIGPFLGIDGNFSACPSFCNTSAGDYHLCDASPCLPGNHPDEYDCGLIGAWGQGCACGPSGVQPTVWSAIKSKYR
jgi:predicted outer membrane repeat protein